MASCALSPILIVSQPRALKVLGTLCHSSKIRIEEPVLFVDENALPTVELALPTTSGIKSFAAFHMMLILKMHTSAGTTSTAKKI